MKQLLALLICFELLIAPIAPSLRLISSSPTKAQTTPSCPDGQYFDGQRGRCIISQDAAQNINSMARCEEISDLTQREQCFKQNAESSLSDEGVGSSNGNADGWDTWGSGIANGATIALGMFAVTHGLKNLSKGGTCAAVSYIAIAAAGASLYISDLAANLKHASNLGKIEDDWKALLGKGEEEEGTNLDDKRQMSLEAQKEAFEMLARAEDSYAQMSKIKAWGHGIATVAFATAVTAAIVEAVNFTDPNNICKPAEGGKNSDATTQAKPADANPNTASRNQTSTGTNGANSPSDTPKITSQSNSRSYDTNGNLIRETTVTNYETPPPPKTAPPATTSRFHDQNPKRDTIFDILNTSYDPELDSDIMKLRNLNNIKEANNFSVFATLMGKTEHQYSSPGLDEFEKNKEIYLEMDQITESYGIDILQVTKVIALNLNPMSFARAEDYSSERYESSEEKYKEIALKSGLSLGIGAAASLLGLNDTIGNFMIHPGVRITLGTILGAWSGYLTYRHIEWMNQAQDRAAKIREIKDNFEAGGDGLSPCKSEDRNNPGKPECYCFTAEGPRNTNRVNSQVCQAYFGLKTDLIASQYGAISSGVNNCIDKNRQPDPKCNCKKSSKGCLVINPNNASLDIGTFKALGGGFKPLNQAMNGSFNPAKTSLADLQNNALRMRNLSKKMLKSKKFAKLGKKVDSDVKKLEQKILQATSGLKSVTPESRPIPTDPKAAVAALEKDLKEAKEQYKDIQAAPGVNPGGGGGGDKEPGLDFGMTAEDLEAQKGDLAKAMNQKLDYGQNDISSSDGNIFDVLSNRYMRSGMRRLFDDEGKIEAEKPAETDIIKK